MMNNMIFLTLCTFMLSLSAAESQEKNKYISPGELLCELVIRNGMIAPDKLKRFPCISKHVNFEASKKLDEHRLTLKNYIQKHYSASYCHITYSPNKLEAAVVEETDIKDGHGYGKLDYFWYVYFQNAKCIKSDHIDYKKSERRTIYPPFFTTTHVCLDFGTDITTPMIYEATKTTGLCWNRITKDAKDSMSTGFFVQCETHRIPSRYIPTGFFARVLPGLYKKIMEQSASFVYEKSIIFYQPPKPGKKIAQWASGPAFTIDLMQTDILTRDDVAILNTFLPNGKYQKWCDIPKKHGYFWLNLLACYGEPHTVLNETDAQIGKQKIKWVGVGKAQVSRCVNTIDVLTNEGEIASFTKDGPFQLLDTTAKATLHYIAQLKKEGIFVEKDWNNKKTLEKRVKQYNQAIQFLRRKRMTWFQHKEDKLICFDAINQVFTVFQCFDKSILTQTRTVRWFSKEVDFHNLVKQEYKGNYSAMFADLYESVGTSSESESSDILVESSGEE